MHKQHFHNGKGKTLLVYISVIWQNDEPVFKAHFPDYVFVDKDKGEKFNVVSSNSWEELLDKLKQEGWQKATLN